LVKTTLKKLKTTSCFEHLAGKSDCHYFERGSFLFLLLHFILDFYKKVKGQTTQKEGYMSLILHVGLYNWRAFKILITAEYAGVDLKVPKFQMEVDNLTDSFLKKNPLGKVPVLETPEGSIFESAAIARYVARLRRDSMSQDKWINGLILLPQNWNNQWGIYYIQFLDLIHMMQQNTRKQTVNLKKSWM